MTDTGSFMFQGTNEHTFALARELVLAGADPSHCARSIYFAHSVAKMRLLGEALRNLNTEGHVGWTWVMQSQLERYGAKEEDCEGLVNYVLSIGEIQVAAFFRQLPDGRFRARRRKLRRRRPPVRQRLLRGWPTGRRRPRSSSAPACRAVRTMKMHSAHSTQQSVINTGNQYQYQYQYQHQHQ